MLPGEGGGGAPVLGVISEVFIYVGEDIWQGM